MGVSFIKGSDHVSIPIEGWIFFSIFVKNKGMFVSGQFSKTHKHLQMRKFLELNEVQKRSTENIQFITNEHFEIFDSLFGRFIWYGIKKEKPRVTLTIQAESHNHIFNMGSGQSPISDQFKSRDCTEYVIDLVYDAENSNMLVSLRYKSELATKNPNLASLLDERAVFTGETV